MKRLFNSISIDVYRSLIENNPDAIFLLDENGIVLDVNSAVATIFGYSHSETIDLYYPDILIPNVDYNVKQLIDSSWNGESSAYQANAYHKNGCLLHLHIKNVPMQEEGRTVGVMVVAKDETELFQMRLALQETSEKLNSIFNSSADAIDIIDVNGDVLAVNPAFEKMYGWDKEEVIGRQLPTIPKSRWNAAEERREKAILGEYTKDLEVDCLKKDGTSIDVSITVSPLLDSEDKVVGFLGISRDITERKILLESLIRSEEKYRLIADNMTDLVSIIDQKGMFKYISPSFQSVLGFPIEDLEGTKTRDHVHPEDLHHIIPRFRSLLSTASSERAEFRIKHKTKGWLWVEAKATFFMDEEHGNPFLLVVSRDIEERKKLQEELKSMAFHDGLTGLPNRRLFGQKMKQAIKEAKRNNQKFALLYMDIDKFKRINDNLGHSIGDKLLKLFGERVSTCLRESDIIARQGGDEFTALLLDLKNREDAQVCAKRILESLQQEWIIDNHTFITTSSIGIALYPDDGIDMDTLMVHADKALYTAKKSGRNTYRLFDNI
ncbi:bifunctional diguanylate cyclase/phosphodiesterase [Bacillus sp. FJAT-22090]|uniref:sensor domain-containing protein n=1 Tax=Bacillus sp. FJAT-22090 TaxID=1581038 RepID=UPI0016427B33|nr:sensor domain-containing diguanylate cyclase [Bacillus sp. FJAT-22090]